MCFIQLAVRDENAELYTILLQVWNLIESRITTIRYDQNVIGNIKQRNRTLY